MNEAVLAAGEVTTGEAVTFWLLAPLALVGAIGMVWARNAVHSALFLACTMLTLGVFYLLQDAPFLGVVQVVVYTGAIMMLFLFVLMLIGRDSSDSLLETLRGQRTAAILMGIGLAAMLCAGLARAVGSITPVGLDAANTNGNVQGIASQLFTNYVFAFEATSALLITAAVGAMLLAHVEKAKSQKITQRDLMRARFGTGSYPAPKPGPGVFAVTNSVTAPGLLPDGTVAGQSVTRLLPTRELTEAEAAPKGTER
ncbi:MAG: NADH-quinone oxidoreductase subunit J [Longispora sp.]|nr:NADH-quinone oxidoreductase subunit J [Longispora sp. (in: high G+C Gram-positive bacteria)]